MALRAHSTPAVLAQHGGKNFPASPPVAKLIQDKATTLWRPSSPPSLAPCSLLMPHLSNPIQRCSHPPPWLLCSTPLFPHGSLGFKPFSPVPCLAWLMDYTWLVSCWVNSNPSRALGVTLPSLAAFATPSSVQSSANIINLLFTFAFRSLIKTLNKPGMRCFSSNFF